MNYSRQHHHINTNRSYSRSFLVDCALTPNGFKIYEFQDTENSSYSGFEHNGGMSAREIIRHAERAFRPKALEIKDDKVWRRFCGHKAIAPLFLGNDEGIMPEQTLMIVPDNKEGLLELIEGARSKFDSNRTVVLKLPSSAMAQGVGFFSLGGSDLERELSDFFGITNALPATKLNSEIAPVVLVQNAEKPIPLGKDGELKPIGGRNSTLRAIFRLGSKTDGSVSISLITSYNKFAPGDYDGKTLTGDNVISKPNLQGYSSRPSREVLNRLESDLIPPLQRVMSEVVQTTGPELSRMMKEKGSEAYSLLEASIRSNTSRTL